MKFAYPLTYSIVMTLIGPSLCTEIYIPNLTEKEKASIETFIPANFIRLNNYLRISRRITEKNNK
jgi:hypothetical protein